MDDDDDMKEDGKEKEMTIIRSLAARIPPPRSICLKI